jgi:hypothetical protein
MVPIGGRAAKGAFSYESDKAEGLAYYSLTTEPIGARTTIRTTIKACQRAAFASALPVALHALHM